MSEQHWLPLWVGDFVSDTAHLSDAETGQYLLLLMCMWRNGGALPDEPVKLARIARCRKVSPTVMDFFRRGNGTISQKRLSAELERSQNVLEQRRSAARRRWSKSLKDNDGVDANASSPHMQPHHTTEGVSKDTPSARGSVLTEDWQPTARDFQWAHEKGFPSSFLSEQTEALRLWADANRNRAVARKASWSKTWQGWMLRHWPEWKRRNPDKASLGTSSGPRRTYREQLAARRRGEND